VAAARSRSHAAKAHDEADEAAVEAHEGAEPVEAHEGAEPVEAHEGAEPVEAHEGAEPVEAHEGAEPVEAPSGISADVQAAREAHASLPVIQSLDAKVEVDQPEVLESLSAERRRLQVEAIETYGLHL